MTETRRIDRRATAAADRSTGTFYCSSSAHRAAGTPIIIRGRRVCQACAAQAGTEGEGSWVI